MTTIQREILSEKDERIKQLEARILKMQHEWNADLGQAVRERDAAIKRAKKAEREVERLNELVTEHDGIECIKHDVLLKAAFEGRYQAEEERDKFRDELGYIANARFYSFSGAEEFRTWAQSRARHALGQEAGTLTVKKGNQ